MRRHTKLVVPGAMNKTTTILILVTTILGVAVSATGDEDMLEPGMPFPAFSLPANDGTTVASSDLEGTPYLLFFYPKADTGG